MGLFPPPGTSRFSLGFKPWPASATSRGRSFGIQPSPIEQVAERWKLASQDNDPFILKLTQSFAPVPMAKRPTAGQQFRGLWLSGFMLVVAYATYGGYLYSLEVSPLRWVMNILFALMLAAFITMGWGPCRRIILCCLTSDLAYFLMALILASLAMAAVTQFRLFASLVLVVAVALLVRVDMLTANVGNTASFLTLSGLSLVGLGLAWIPHLLRLSPHTLAG